MYIDRKIDKQIEKLKDREIRQIDKDKDRERERERVKWKDTEIDQEKQKKKREKVMQNKIAKELKECLLSLRLFKSKLRFQVN